MLDIHIQLYPCFDVNLYYTNILYKEPREMALFVDETLWLLRDFDGCDADISADENAGFIEGWSYKAIR